jgi:hypothetical protein
VEGRRCLLLEDSSMQQALGQRFPWSLRSLTRIHVPRLSLRDHPSEHILSGGHPRPRKKFGV